MDDNEKEFTEKIKSSIFKKKVRCNLCHEIPIIKEILSSNGVNCFITSECLNRHGLFLCPLKDFCNDKSQLDKIKCSVCNSVQDIANSLSKLFIFCKECKKFFCPTCLKLHFKNNLKDHHFSYINEVDYKCKEHLRHFSFFCENCKMNLCPLCYQKNHFKHKNIIHFDNIKPTEKAYRDIKFKLEEQKAQIDIISEYLENFLKIITRKVTEYINTIKLALNFNYQIFNCYNKDRLNYQSIINLDKIIDIDITDVSFITDIQNELDQCIQMLKTKSSYKSLSSQGQLTTPNVDKELLKTVKSALGRSKTFLLSEVSFDKINFKDKKEKEEKMEKMEKMDANDFVDNELLAKIGKTNTKILNIKDILGTIKNIYSMDELKIYLLIIDNGIFIYDQETSDIFNYIDINEGFEYNEIDKFSCYYNIKEKLVYLFVSTKNNIIKIYTINEDFDYKLIQELQIDNLNNLSCNKNGELLVEDKNVIYIYHNEGENYKKGKEIDIEKNKKIKNIYHTENYLILFLEEKDELILYNNNNIQKILSLEKIFMDEKSKIFEISKNFVCVSFKNKISVINIEEKKICFRYEKGNINNIECAEVINTKNIFISCENKDNKLVLYILEWDEDINTLKEINAIKDLDCKMICKINNNKAILYTKYGLNLLELKD